MYLEARIIVENVVPALHAVDLDGVLMGIIHPIVIATASIFMSRNVL